MKFSLNSGFNIYKSQHTLTRNQGTLETNQNR